MITNLPTDWYQFAKQNITLDHAPLILGCAALTAALIVVDRPTWLPFKNAYESSTPLQRLAEGGVFLGDGKFQFGLAGLFGAYGLLAPKSANSERALRTASQTVEVILACGAVVQLLKHLTGRESPIVATERNGRWQFFPNQIEYANHVPHYDAFPSGHLATATATLLVIANNYPEVTWLRPFGYVVLGGITTSLVLTSIHWWSDFPLGFALGYAFGTLLSPSTELATKTDHSEVVSPISHLLSQTTIYPTVVAGSTGIGLTIRLNPF
jgi:membrane-associated phospholipid phosphatase